MLIGTSKGLPGEFLLLFTLLIWVLFFLVYLGNRHNRLNRWCFISGMCFSMGVFKEYLYFTLFPAMMRAWPGGWMTWELSQGIYSVLTAVLYYFAMPAALVFGFYFSRMDECRPKLFRWARIWVFVPALVFDFFYPYLETRHYQLFDRTYYFYVALYNWLYGVLLTVLLLVTLWRERGTAAYRQKKMVAILALVPIWYQLTSVFLIHLLNLKSLFKVWQGNSLVILFLIIFYLYNAFKGGFMGARFQHESYEWNQDGKLVNQSAQFIRHMLKNEVVKIEWCAQNIQQSGPEKAADYVDIILRSTNRLKELSGKALHYSKDIVLDRQVLQAAPLLEACVADYRKLSPEIQVEVRCGEGDELFCDRVHLTEVLNNLLNNAGEAMHGRGSITVEGKPAGRGYQISVSDTGDGIPKERLGQLFAPYYTTKASSHHMGLGLYYCRNVMRKHGGSIQAWPNEGCGATFVLRFPRGARGRKGGLD